MSIYKLIRNNAKNWWWHKQLRDRGDVDEARILEHKSAKSTIKHIRQVISNKGYFSIGPFGWALHIGLIRADWASDPNTTEGITVSGYGDGEPYYTACLEYGVPIVDCRDTPIEVRLNGMKVPLAAIGLEQPDQGPNYGSLSKAPLIHVLKKYQEIGYTVLNMPEGN